MQGDAAVLGAPPREPRALSAEYVHELLLGPVPHLLQILLVVAQIEVDVGFQPPELDRRAIIGPRGGVRGVEAT